MRVLLADLGHNQLTISSDIYPLGVANLAMYLGANFRGKEPLDVRIFRDPAELKPVLDDEEPAILALSSYAWNHNLARAYAQYAKRRYPNLLTVVGGPHFPLTRDEQESYLRSVPEFDVASRGPTYEGERAFLNVVQRYHDVGCSIEGLQEEMVPANVWVRKKDGEFMHGGEIERIVDLDEIPSPYQAGLMDPYLTTGYFPMLQMSRGCPFTCAFCNSAVADNNRVFRHSVDNVYQDLLFLAERVKPETPVCFADDNFGMYPWDEELADRIAHLQDRFGWPQYLRTTTGKNRSDRIIRVMRTIRGALPMTAAVQSLNPEVLKNIERDNISLQAYADIQKEVQAQGMQAYGELILCLPGETKQSFMQAVNDLLETGVSRVSAHQLMLLYGAPLADPDRREKHGFGTRFRVVARNISDYLGEPVIETEEIVVETPTFSFQDYLDCRVFHLLLTIFFYEDNFEEAFAYAKQKGVKPFDVIVKLQELLPEAPAEFRQTVEDFVRESKDELFDTVEACEEWSRQHFAELVNGELGGNLLSKYSMLGRFFVTSAACEFLETGIRRILEERATQGWRIEGLHAVMGYLKAILLSSPFRASLDADPTWTTEYDVVAWKGDQYRQPLAEYAFEAPRTFATRVDPKRQHLIEHRIEAFGDNPQGLGKFTRTMFAQDLRRDVVAST
jgi:radical SAM superfamily enzyme YgiQ (UPF0313 family)